MENGKMGNSPLTRATIAFLNGEGQNAGGSGKKEKYKPNRLLCVDPLDIPDFNLCGKPIGRVDARGDSISIISNHRPDIGLPFGCNSCLAIGQIQCLQRTEIKSVSHKQEFQSALLA